MLTHNISLRREESLRERGKLERECGGRRTEDLAEAEIKEAVLVCLDSRAGERAASCGEGCCRVTPVPLKAAGSSCMSAKNHKISD